MVVGAVGQQGSAPGSVPGGHRLLDLLGDLERTLDEVLGEPSWQLPEEVLVAALRRFDGLRIRAEAARLGLVAEFDKRGCGLSRGASSTAAWLRAAGRCRPGQAARDVALARAITGPCAQTGAALREGRITVDAAAVVTSTMSKLPDGLPVGKVAQAQTMLLEAAVRHEPGMLNRMAAHLLTVTEATWGEGLSVEEQRVEEQRIAAQERAVTRRELHLIPDLGGNMLLIRGQVDAEAGAALRTAIASLAAPRPAQDGTPDRRSPGRRNADALIELVDGVLDGGGLPTSGGQRPHLTVTVALADLKADLDNARPGWAAGGLTDWGVELSAEATRRLACDAQVIPVVLDGAGQPLDVGRGSYPVPTPMRNALIARDQGCTFPICDRPPQWCHAHHIKHWADGGETKLANLTLLCAHHHRLIHNSEWAVSIGIDGRPEYLPPPWIEPLQIPWTRDWTQQLENFAGGKDGFPATSAGDQALFAPYWLHDP